MKTFPLTATILSPLALLASCGNAAPGDSQSAAASPAGDGFRMEELGRFEEPWAAAFVPGSDYLVVTERGGAIKLRSADGTIITVSGAPKVDYGGQGGLGDVLILPAREGTAYPVYLSWAEAGDGDTRGAVVGRGELILDEMQGSASIRDLKVIWRQPKVSGRGHFSHRLAISPDGRYLFVASGDRQKMTPAQDTANNLGSVVRLNLDGSPAAGNAFTGQAGKAPDIWSYGHRNILGLAFDAQGRLWDLEHGPAGGDELNLVTKGANYGWPVVSEGDHYDGKDIPPHSTRPEFAAPAISWNPVIAPGDFIFYSGKLFTGWKGQAIIAAMKPAGLVRVSFDGGAAREVARHATDRRIREVIEAPDGSIWVLEDKTGARLWRLTPQ